jgi:hypothetical protein
MRLNVSDIMVIEAALRVAAREYESDARVLTESSLLRSMLLEDTTKAARLLSILKNAVSAEVYLFEDRETAA